MGVKERHAVIRKEMKAPVKAVPSVCFGGTEFAEPFAGSTAGDEARFLGVRDLYMKFVGVRDSRGADEGLSPQHTMQRARCR